MQWSIERLVPGGDGLARLDDGRVGFASGVQPGDRIEVLSVEVRRGYCRATRWRLLEAGRDRVTPECPVAESCGGCDWMALARPAQLEHKVAIVKDALVRVGRLSIPPTIEVVSAGSAVRYRSRIRLHIGRNGQIGLFARGSHRLVEIPHCLVCESEIDEALSELRAVARRHPGGLAPFSEVEIRWAPRAPRITLRFTRRERWTTGTKSGPSRGLVEELSTRFPVDADEGAPSVQTYSLPGGVALEAPTGVFTQVNWAVNERLVNAVVDGAVRRSVRRFCDLYAGAGNFALALLARALDGVAIEEARPAIRAAERCADRQRFSGGRFVHGDVGASVRELVKRGERFDLVIADPPRTGARAAIDAIVRLKAPFVALCSCDPPTLARDAARLVSAGYVLESTTVYDMFPQTHHAEVLLWLHARPAS